mgnify:CR=1 FL=1
MEDVFIFEDMIGKKFDKVFQHTSPSGEDFMIFEKDGLPEFIFYHAQDCCESVYIEDVEGDLSDLSSGVIIEAEEYSKEVECDEYGEHTTYTFYKFSSTKGGVNIRWCGSSNGYYSERVDLFSLKGKDFWATYHLTGLFKELYPTLEV